MDKYRSSQDKYRQVHPLNDDEEDASSQMVRQDAEGIVFSPAHLALVKQTTFNEPASPFSPKDVSILWDPNTFHKRRSLVVPVPRYLTPDHTAKNTTAMAAVKVRTGARPINSLFTRIVGTHALFTHAHIVFTPDHTAKNTTALAAVKVRTGARPFRSNHATL
jgi:hypothetical protein